MPYLFALVLILSQQPMQDKSLVPVFPDEPSIKIRTAKAAASAGMLLRLFQQGYTISVQQTLFGSGIGTFSLGWRIEISFEGQEPSIGQAESMEEAIAEAVLSLVREQSRCLGYPGLD